MTVVEAMWWLEELELKQALRFSFGLGLCNCTPTNLNDCRLLDPRRYSPMCVPDTDPAGMHQTRAEMDEPPDPWDTALHHHRTKQTRHRHTQKRAELVRTARRARAGQKMSKSGRGDWQWQ